MSMGALDQNLTSEAKGNLYGDAYFNMLWFCPSDPRFPYWVHIPRTYAEDDATYQLMVIIQHTGCGVAEYLEAAKPLADKHHLALLAPVFPSGIVDRDDFNSYKLLSCDGIRYDLALLAMIDDMKKRYPRVETDRFFMFGHSGGGQFSNRFLLAHPERLEAVTIGAPGRPTFIDFDTDYYWGVRDFRSYFDKDVDVEEVAKVPVQISVGELDTQYIGESPYGTNRVSRMKSLSKNLTEAGVSNELVILPGLEHGDGADVRVKTAQRFFLGLDSDES